MHHMGLKIHVPKMTKGIAIQEGIRRKRTKMSAHVDKAKKIVEKEKEVESKEEKNSLE